jgi:hypothetical protein
MIVPLTVVVNMRIMNMLIVNMQGQHAAMGLVQNVNDRRSVGVRKRNRRTKDTKRIGGDQQSCPPAPQSPGQTNPHCFQTKRADRDSTLKQFARYLKSLPPAATTPPPRTIRPAP